MRDCALFLNREIFMNRITLQPDDSAQTVDFYVIDEAKLAGKTYLLVSDTEEGDGEALILREGAGGTEPGPVYEIVDDDNEISAALMLFKDELDDLGILLE